MTSELANHLIFDASGPASQAGGVLDSHGSLLGASDNLWLSWGTIRADDGIAGLDLRFVSKPCFLLRLRTKALQYDQIHIHARSMQNKKTAIGVIMLMGFCCGD